MFVLITLPKVLYHVNTHSTTNVTRTRKAITAGKF